ncbi:MAG: prepilin-type N-terminal cleavage/methylation domain-containing protein [Candidatus Riflebacteria bacterium]|nr:prepilin-type N-terminal cleavage/methylation domain-containing protein [Candidatus Riflebacteria bacterium]
MFQIITVKHINCFEKAGFSLMEILLSLALFGILGISIHQSLSITYKVAEANAARMRCMVTASNILEQAQATPGTFTEVLVRIVKGGSGGVMNNWYEVPASYYAGGMIATPSARIATASIMLDAAAATVAVILVEEKFHGNQVDMQVFRDPLE